MTIVLLGSSKLRLHRRKVQFWEATDIERRISLVHLVLYSIALWNNFEIIHLQDTSLQNYFQVLIRKK